MMLVCHPVTVRYLWLSNSMKLIFIPGVLLLSSVLLVAAVGAQTTVVSSSSTETSSTVKPLVLQYDQPAPDSDLGWANASLPLGNGYMGVNVFGGIDTERIQITENSLYDWGKDRGLKRRGLNNFAEVYIDFDHGEVNQYQRALDLNAGLSLVTYERDGVEFRREYFTSYPDKVMVIRLSASSKGALSFTLRPTIPFIGEGKTGAATADGDTVTLSGEMTHYKILFEGQFKVVPEGGQVKTDSDQGTIEVTDADSAVILIAVGTNYQLDSKVFLENEPEQKLAGFPAPHEKVSQYINDAAAKSFDQLKAAHQSDYKTLFDRVRLDLGATAPTTTTDKIVDAYPDGEHSRYLEELAFQFGRYMLICSSRKGTLPPHLQGIWNVYARPPWSSQYLHDTNVQMAYAPVFSANLPELFESYADFFKAFEPRQRKYATQYIQQFHSAQLDPDGNNGWSGPFWANPYTIPGKSPVAGFGTGSWIGKMFWDYYDYTRDKTLLAETVYPVMYQQANFASRFVQDIDGVLLAKPSSSPEQKKRDTIGTTFDQQMFYENHHNTLIAAKILGRSDDRLELFEKQLPLLDPIQIGKSGQIKEFRQEEYYGEFGDPHHRHTSMLLGEYPGQLINDTTPAWLDAVEVSLRKRTNKSHIGWARAERIAFWARVHDGDEAYTFYQDLLEGNFLHNLFNDHRGGPLFQADANYGATAGVAEMLMQSQDYVISPLTALPTVWPSGSYQGLLARGNFEVSAVWNNGKATSIEVLSKSGGELKVRYPNIAKSQIRTGAETAVQFDATGDDLVTINTTRGQTYTFTDLVDFKIVPPPSGLKIETNDEEAIVLRWDKNADADSYNVYRAVGNAPEYERVQFDVEETTLVYPSQVPEEIEQMTFKVKAVKGKRESKKGSAAVWLKK